MKIRQVGTELFHADGPAGGRTGGKIDRQTTNIIVAFRNFANAPENSAFCSHGVFTDRY
jgi:hypothetical protein